MQPIIRLGPDEKNPWPFLITATMKPKNADPIGAALRDAQQAELDIRYNHGELGHEPGIKPTGDNTALFIVAYPVLILHSPETSEDIEAKLLPIACGGLRDLGDGYMEIKRMYAAPNARGTGAAQSILLALEQYARNIGVKALRLETGNRQQDAMRYVYCAAEIRENQLTSICHKTILRAAWI
ncbi:GNAT family acetyltransferase [Ceratobasidium sp. AG-Ba]|nr:GNAT family acetyltransferase [Ceratobasidium sp. AG-Ba]QRW03282.1 GNAT family acetyltransferase [Ceratobasidium sp. AG-Ba]